MADTVKNFFSSTTTSGDFNIIPTANGTDRDLASLLEIHDLNITASKNESSLDENWQAIIDIYIKDNENNYFLYNYIILKDGESWHNEKSFSLMYNQSLYFKVRNNISNGKVTVSSSCFQREDLNAEYYTLTLNTNPTNANAILTCGSLISTNKKLKVPSGSTVSYTVSASNYATTTGNSIVNSDKTLNINLIKLYYVKITTNAENPTITLSAAGYTQQNDLIYVQKGTTVSYTVSAPNYVTKTGTITIDNNNPKDIIKQVELELQTYTFTINPDPNNADVLLTASGYTQSGKSITVKYGTTVSWKVSKQLFTTKSGTYKVTKNYTMPVTLELPINTVLFESSQPGTYSLQINRSGLYEIQVVSGGGGGAAQGDSYKYKSSSAGGGSGAYGYASFTLSSGTTYNINVGSGGKRGLNEPGYQYYNKSKGPGWCPTGKWLPGGNGETSSVGNLITCTGGTGGRVSFTDGNPKKEAGTGGVCTISNYKTIITKKNGNNGQTTTNIVSTPAQGGTSLYINYGAGGSARATGHNNATANAGASGYVKIVYKG